MIFESQIIILNKASDKHQLQLLAFTTWLHLAVKLSTCHALGYLILRIFCSLNMLTWSLLVL